MARDKKKPKPRPKGPRATAVPPSRRTARPVQLRWLAHARSGDKGDTANVGLIALEPEYYPILKKEVTAARVARHFQGMITGVDRFELPNLDALNFLLHGALDGGKTIQAIADRIRIRSDELSAIVEFLH